MEEKLWTKNYIMALIAMFGVYLTSAILLSLMAIHAKNLTDMDTYAGLMVSTFTLGALSVRFVAGGLTDRFSSKIVIITGLIILIIASIWLLVTTNIYFLLTVRTMQGIGFGLAATAISTLVAKICHPTRLLDGIGYLAATQSLTMVLGPSIGFWIVGVNYDRFNWLFITAIVLGVATLLVMLLEKGGKIAVNIDHTYELGESTTWSVVVLPLIVLFMNALSQSAITSFLALYAISLNLIGIGSFFSVNAIGMIIARFIMNKLVRRFGQFHMIIVNTIVFATTIFLITQAKSIPMMLLIAFPAGFSMGSVAPIVNTHLLQMMPYNKKGIANALYFSGLDIGFGLGSVIWGFVATGMGYVQVFYFSGVLQTVAVFVMVLQLIIVKRDKLKRIA